MTEGNSLARSIERHMGCAGVPGLSAALVERDRVVWTEGFGRCRNESGDRISAETVFAVASLSKPPFAHLVLRLCERGTLDLDTPLAGLHPEPELVRGTPELRGITARHVLSHTSGLGNFEEGDMGRTGSPPGSRWRYSGEGYLYLQAVVEHLTASPLEHLAEVEVFEPLALTSTTYHWRTEPGARAGHERPPSQGHEFTKAVAAWSLHTTARDYARFVVETMHSEIGEALLTLQVEIDDSLAWGLGWGLAGDVFWHWGDMGFRDFQCVAVASRTQGRGLVLLTNSNHGLSACAEILDDVLGDGYSHPIRAVLERGW